MAHQLIGREEALEQALHAVRYGGGVLISGGAGVGKTALAAAVADGLGQPPVGWVVATAAGRDTPLGALATLLPSDLATIHPALVPQHFGARLRSLAGGRASPVLVVDDAQLLDERSAAVVLSLVSARTLRLVATMRTGGSPSDAVTALWKERLLERLDLTPLRRTEARVLLESILGGPVASGTAELLWKASHGNPFSITELARFGADSGRLHQEGGVWWWQGETEMPPRLGELLLRRIDALSPAGQAALDLLAMGEPLPYETLGALTDEEAILELDRAEIAVSDERDGVLMLRFAHPLLHTAAERRLSPARRRSLAARLRQAPAAHVDLVRRATWEEASGAEPNVDLLRAAADAVLLSDPQAAVRFAGRAHRTAPSLQTAMLLAAAQSESGRPDLARLTVDHAPTPTGPAEEFMLVGGDFPLSLWGERNPERAAEVLRRLRQRLPASYADDLDGVEATYLLFTGRCADARAVAQAVLERRPEPSPRLRALTCLTAALAFSDRGDEAIDAGRQLVEALSTTRVSGTRAGLAYAMVALSGLLFASDYQLPPSIGTLGRWPGTAGQPVAAGRPEATADTSAELGWSLLVGLRRHLRGDLTGALGPLREAFVQQHSGEGMFRSEATAELIVVLAELGEADEAARLLAAHPPDGVAIIPGLADWCSAAVSGAQGHRSDAASTAIRAARRAAEHGVAAMAMNFLLDAARWGDPSAAAAALPGLGVALDTDLQRARAVDLAARAGSVGAAAVADAAEVQLSAGFYRHAAELADLALRTGGDGALERRVAAVIRQSRSVLGDQLAVGGTRTNGLTRREDEVTSLARRGLSDKDIAQELFLSVRTVQSHLASAYRKLGISSRGELPAADGS